MKILLSGDPITKSAGIGEHTINLANALVKKLWPGSVTLLFSTQPKRSIYEKYGLDSSIKIIAKKAVNYNDYDIYHATNHQLPKIKNSRIKKVLTIHDLASFKKEKYFSIAQKIYKYFKIKQAVRRADLFIAVSEHTKNDAIKYLKIAPEKIKVVYNIINDIYYRKELPRAKLDLPSKYILTVGTIEPRKNYVNLIKAFNKLKDDSISLIIVGKKGWLYGKVLAEAEHSPKKDKIFIQDGLSNKAELITIYRRAELFIYPSFYEGFGLPPVEAMLLDKKVLCSRTSSLPEVTGGQAVYFSPDNIAGITRKIEENLNKKAIKKDSSFTEKYRSENIAGQMTAIYEQLLVKKILQINKLYYPWIGGIETVVRQLADGLNIAKKVQVSVLAVNEKNTKEKVLSRIIDGVKVTKTRLNFFFGAQPISLGFFKELKKQQADIYHFHFPDSWSILAALWARPQGKMVLTYHSDIVRQKILRLLFLPFLLVFLKKVNVIVATSPNLVNSSLILKFFRKKVVVIPLAIEPMQYTVSKPVLNKMREQYGTDFILAIGRLVPYKGFTHLIEAMKYLHAERLIIVGDGFLGKQLKAQIIKNNLQQCVKIISFLDFAEIKALYQLCKIFVLPSIGKNEAFGIVQMEAMYFNKPVVSTDLPTGVTYINRDKQTGLVVKRKSGVALAAAIKELSNNKQLYNKISRHNKSYILNNFIQNKMITAYLALYEHLSCA